MKFKGPVFSHTCVDHVIDSARGQALQDLFVVAITQGKTNGTFLEIGAAHPVHTNNTYLLETEFGWSGTSIDVMNYSDDLTSFEKIWCNFYHAIRGPDWPNALRIEELPTELQKECKELHGYDDFVLKYNHCRHAIDDIPRSQRTWPNLRPGTNFVHGDAFDFDYQSLLPYVDYLQIDIDPPGNNLEILKKILLSGLEFGVITFEHDAWRNTTETHAVREQSRALLHQQGYQLIVGDVCLLSEYKTPWPFEDWYANTRTVPTSIIQSYQWINPTTDAKYCQDILFQKT